MIRVAALLLLALSLVACGDDAPPAVPAGYVVTPHGLLHRSCVRALAPDERISASGVITGANGERESLDECPYARLNARSRQPSAAGTFATTSGWIEASTWTSPSALGSLSAAFAVPTLPATSGGTTFFFPGAEPEDGSTILQPVLQYGESAAGGGDSWTAASWFCCPAGWSFYSSLIDVNPGDNIVGTMTADCSGSSCDWNVLTADTTLGTSSLLSASDVTSPFMCLYGGVLESYSVSDCDQYPSSGTITFSNITLLDQNGESLQPDWSTFVNTGDPMCAYAAQATSTATTLEF